MTRFPTGSPRWRRATVGAAALLLACAPVAACSSDSDDNPLGIGTFDPEAMASAEASESAAAAAASASAAASAEAAGIVTAESLSTDRYVVTSIPEGLDEQQTEVLKAFINYDQVTWNIWFTGAGVENAEPLVTADVYQTIVNNYEASNGEVVDGGLRIAVTSVVAASPYSMEPRTEIRTCSDQSGLTAYDTEGNDVTNPEVLRGRFDVRIILVNVNGAWRVSSEQKVSTNECVA